MIIKKWDYQTKSYHDFEVPDNYHCPLQCDDLKEKINCPHCGKEILFKDGCTSLELHTKKGAGYSVCPECYEEESKRFRKYVEGLV